MRPSSRMEFFLVQKLDYSSSQSHSCAMSYSSWGASDGSSAFMFLSHPRNSSISMRQIYDPNHWRNSKYHEFPKDSSSTKSFRYVYLQKKGERWNSGALRCSSSIDCFPDFSVAGLLLSLFPTGRGTRQRLYLLARFDKSYVQERFWRLTGILPCHLSSSFIFYWQNLFLIFLKGQKRLDCSRLGNEHLFTTSWLIFVIEW